MSAVGRDQFRQFHTALRAMRHITALYKMGWFFVHVQIPLPSGIALVVSVWFWWELFSGSLPISRGKELSAAGSDPATAHALSHGRVTLLHALIKFPPFVRSFFIFTHSLSHQSVFLSTIIFKKVLGQFNHHNRSLLSRCQDLLVLPVHFPVA